MSVVVVVVVVLVASGLAGVREPARARPLAVRICCRLAMHYYC